MLNESGNFELINKEEIVFGLIYYYRDFLSKQYEPIIFYEKEATNKSVKYHFYDILKNDVDWVLEVGFIYIYKAK